MNHQHANRKERGEGFILKQIVQFMIMFVCFWLIYQIYHSLYAKDRDYGYNEVEKKIRNERIGRLFGRRGGFKLSHNAKEMELYGMDYDLEKKFRNERNGKFLGRKGGLGSSHNAEGMELYGVDMIGAAERIKHVAEDDEESDVGSNFSEGNEEEGEPSHNDANNALDSRELRGFSTKEGEIGEKIQEKKANASTRNEGRTLMSEKRSDKDEKVESLVSFGAVILKKDDKNLGVFRFNDETWVPKHDSAPSRRSDIQVESSLKGDILRVGNSSNGIKSCQKLSLQNNSDKQSLNKSDRKADHEELKDLTLVESGKGSMRELLQKEV